MKIELFICFNYILRFMCVALCGLVSHPGGVFSWSVICGFVVPSHTRFMTEQSLITGFGKVRKRARIRNQNIEDIQKFLF